MTRIRLRLRLACLLRLVANHLDPLDGDGINRIIGWSDVLRAVFPEHFPEFRRIPDTEGQPKTRDLN